MAIHNLFPIPIGRYSLGRDMTAKELSFLVNQERRSNTGNMTSVNSMVLQDKSLTQLRDFIETSLADYFQAVHFPKHAVNLKITQSWTNYTEPGQFHHKHAHPNSFVSGVFYVQADKSKDKIYFYKDGYHQIKFPPTEWNMWNSDSWWFDVGVGNLILFPSSLQHMVQTVDTEQTRISLSFNTFPVGQVGDEMDLTKINLGELHGAFYAT